MPTTFNVISLGILPDIDPTDGNILAENAAALVGMTFGGVNDSLVNDFVSFSPGSTGFDGGVVGTYDQSNTPSEAFSIDGGPDQIFDSAARYFATITYIDGTTDSIEVVIFQDTSGATYLAPDTTQNANQDALELAAIRSISLDGVSFASTNGLVADRNAFEFVTCFTPGVRIAVPGGETPIEDLSVGDLVRTRDDGAQAIRWIGRVTRCTGGALTPIRIYAGSLGNGLPRRDILVSQQHRMLASSKIVKRVTGACEILLAAKKLLCVPGVELAEDLPEVTYIHWLLDRHEIIYADGAPTESLYLGPQAERAVGQEAMREIRNLFPEIVPQALQLARMVPMGEALGQMVYRHWKNQQPMLQTFAQ